MNRTDLYIALVLIAFGIGVVAESWRMPRFENLGVDPYTAPGVVPGFLGAAFVLFGTIMLVRTWRARNASREASAPGTQPGGTRRLLVSLALMLGFGGVLVGTIPFWLATFLFVAAFILVFELRDPRVRGSLLRTASVAVIEGALVAAAVTFVFERIFLVRLP